MMIDGRTVADGSTMDADLCVIGAGAAGITIARELVGGPHDVILVESGGLAPSDEVQALSDGEVVGLPIGVPLGTTHLRYFGGTTNHWAGECRPLDPVDFEAKPYLRDSGWPFGVDEMAPFYERAFRVVGLGPGRFDRQSWADTGLLAPLTFESDVFAASARQITAAARLGEVHRRTIADSNAVRVLLWSSVVDLELGDDDRTIASVRVGTLDGRTFRVRAGTFVLATGGIAVPRLLLATRSRTPKGLGNSHDLVGRYFAEHPGALGGLVLTDTPDLFQGVVPYSGARSDGSTFEVVVAPWFTMVREALLADELLSMQINVLDPDVFAGIDRDDYPTMFGARFDAAQALLSGQGAGPLRAAPFLINFEQEPNRASRVTLSEERDALGLPRARLDWRLSDDDRRRTIRALRRFGDEIGRNGLGRVRVALTGSDGTRSFTGEPDSEDGANDFPVNINYHHMGTARMHPSPRHGVVDEHCRVHDTSNLYVAGSAVFPTYGANPPTLTIVALALRLSDHLTAGVLPRR